MGFNKEMVGTRVHYSGVVGAKHFIWACRSRKKVFIEGMRKQGE